MAENLDDGEFWLPPQFLDDNDDDETASFPSNEDSLYHSSGDDFVFPFGSSTGAASSDLSSPISGSSETESDEDDHLHRVAELTHRVAHSTLHSHSTKPTGGYASGSPQSTLCAFRCGNGSSEGSPSSVCNLCSAKATWDLLHAAAGEVERMRLSQQQQQQQQSQLPSYPYNPSPSIPNTAAGANSDFSFYTQQALSHQKQFQIAQIQMLRQQQESVWGGKGVYQRRQSNQMGARNRGGRSVRPLGLSPSAWPSLHAAKNQNKHHKHHNQQQQQQYGSGMRAVFLTNPSTTRECAGTGVFLPRRVDTPETKKKPACATVLVPARVAQALNLNVDDMVGCLPHRFNSSSNMEEHVVSPRLRSNYVHTSQQKRNVRPQHALNSNNEIKLPQEWTY